MVVVVAQSGSYSTKVGLAITSLRVGVSRDVQWRQGQEVACQSRQPRVINDQASDGDLKEISW